jgi:hypothetical protein
MFTSPSDNHDAFRVWNGTFRNHRPSPLINTGDSVFCTDGVWRQSVTLDAACQRGAIYLRLRKLNANTATMIIVCCLAATGLSLLQRVRWQHEQAQAAKQSP